MKTINFTKMQSLGNDFVIFDQLKDSYKFTKNQIKKFQIEFWNRLRPSFSNKKNLEKKKFHLNTKYIIKMEASQASAEMEQNV